MQKRAETGKEVSAVHEQISVGRAVVQPSLPGLPILLPIYFLATLPFAFPILTAGGASYVHLAFWLLLTAGGVTLLFTGKLMQF